MSTCCKAQRLAPEQRHGFPGAGQRIRGRRPQVSDKVDAAVQHLCHEALVENLSPRPNHSLRRYSIATGEL